MQPSCIAGAGGNRSSIVITIQDGCPGCPANQLALHPLTFARLANLSRNAIPVRYRQASAAALRPAVPQLLLKAEDEHVLKCTYGKQCLPTAPSLLPADTPLPPLHVVPGGVPAAGGHSGGGGGIQLGRGGVDAPPPGAGKRGRLVCLVEVQGLPES